MLGTAEQPLESADRLAVAPDHAHLGAVPGIAHAGAGETPTSADAPFDAPQSQHARAPDFDKHYLDMLDGERGDTTFSVHSNHSNTALIETETAPDPSFDAPLLVSQANNADKERMVDGERGDTTFSIHSQSESAVVETDDSLDPVSGALLVSSTLMDGDAGDLDETQDTTFTIDPQPDAGVVGDTVDPPSDALLLLPSLTKGRGSGDLDNADLSFVDETQGDTTFSIEAPCDVDVLEIVDPPSDALLLLPSLTKGRDSGDLDNADLSFVDETQGDTTFTIEAPCDADGVEIVDPLSSTLLFSSSLTMNGDSGDLDETQLDTTTFPAHSSQSDTQTCPEYPPLSLSNQLAGDSQPADTSSDLASGFLALLNEENTKGLEEAGLAQLKAGLIAFAERREKEWQAEYDRRLDVMRQQEETTAATLRQMEADNEGLTAAAAALQDAHVTNRRYIQHPDVIVTEQSAEDREMAEMKEKNKQLVRMNAETRAGIKELSRVNDMQCTVIDALRVTHGELEKSVESAKRKLINANNGEFMEENEMAWDKMQLRIRNESNKQNFADEEVELRKKEKESRKEIEELEEKVMKQERANKDLVEIREEIERKIAEDEE